jgi:hypothetical protein
MEVSDELRGLIKATVTAVLDKYASDPELDNKLTDAVTIILKTVETNMVGVKYIGKRSAYSDSLFETGSWIQGQSKLVPEKTAKRMLQHPDVYTHSEDAVEIVSEKHTTEDDRMDEARNMIASMNRKKQIVDYMTSHCLGSNLNLSETASVSDYKTAALTLIEQYGLAPL